MRLLQLSVKSFCGIAEAHIQLQPGLNILFGPNEAGKSTLAAALRAALLSRTSSATTASAYLPATGSGPPEVSLTLDAQNGDWLRINKTFGERGSTSLERSANQGQTFVREQTGDGAETAIRQHLRWGLRMPGGKRGARKAESTFLTRVLLAEQTEVDTIFDQGLEPDSTEQVSFIQEALAAAMEDPRYKRALKLAHGHFDRYYTPTGRKTQGENSPWKKAANLVREAQANLEAAQKVAHDIDALESALRDAKHEAKAVQGALEERKAHRQTLESQLEAAKHRAVLVQKVGSARDDLDHAIAVQRKVEALSAQAAELTKAIQERTAELEAADAAVGTTRQRQSEAQTKLQRAESAEGHAQRELEVARIESRERALGQERADLQRDMKAAEALTLEERALSAQRSRIAREKAALADHEALEARAKKQIEELEAERTATLILDADRRLQTARAREEEAGDKVLAAQTAAQQAEQKNLIETQLLQQIKTYGDLTAAQLAQVRKLHHNLDKHRSTAEAGLSIAIERLQVLAIDAQADDEAGVAHALSTDRIEVEARRQVRLDLGGLARLEISTGSPEVRAELAKAEAAWAQHGRPVLDRHTVSSVDALEQRLRERMLAEQRLRDVQREHEDLRTRARQLPEAQNALAEAQGETARAEVERAALPSRIAVTPTRPARVLEQLLQDLQGSARTAEAARIAGSATLHQLDEHEQHKAAQVAEQQRLLGAPATELLTRGGARLSAIAQEEATLNQQKKVLEQGQAEALQAAHEEVTNATAALEAAELRKRHLAEGRRQLEQDLSETKGALNSEKGHLDALDIGDRKQRLADAEALLNAHPVGEIEPSQVDAADAQMRLAESQLEEAKRHVISLESRIESSQGALGQERLQEAQEAYDRAEADFKATEIDGKANELLIKALREAEESSSRHVGTALGREVEARFAELTRDRYHGLSVDKTLVAQKIQLGEAVLRPDQLSVGTRHQLAILLRLILAEQLGHPIVLDDQLVQSDPERLAWFRKSLTESATRTQILVLSCRPTDYYSLDDAHAIHLVNVPNHVKLNREQASHRKDPSRKAASG